MAWGLRCWWYAVSSNSIETTASTAGRTVTSQEAEVVEAHVVNPKEDRRRIEEKNAERILAQACVAGTRRNDG